MTGGGFDASLTELAIAGLDAETMSVDVKDPLGDFQCDAPKGINQGLLGHGGVGRADRDDAPRYGRWLSVDGRG